MSTDTASPLGENLSSHRSQWASRLQSSPRSFRLGSQSTYLTAGLGIRAEQDRSWLIHHVPSQPQPRGKGVPELWEA